MPGHKITICLPVLLLALQLAYPALAQPGAAKPSTATISGRVVLKGEPAPANMRIHLVHAETAAADALLRYDEVAVGKDNAFEFKNMAPGKYRLLPRAAPNAEPSDHPPTPAAWDAVERAKLRKEAVAMKIEVELKPCQRVTDQIVRYVRQP